MEESERKRERERERERERRRKGGLKYYSNRKPINKGPFSGHKILDICRILTFEEYVLPEEVPTLHFTPLLEIF